MPKSREEYLKRLLGKIKERGKEKQDSFFVRDPDLQDKPLYHGSGSMFESGNIRPSDRGTLFGPGVYLTDEPGVAKSYTKKGKTPDHTLKRTGEPRLSPNIKQYRLKEGAKLLDLQKPLGEKEAEIFNKAIDSFYDSPPDDLKAFPGQPGFKAFETIRDASDNIDAMDFEDAMAEFQGNLRDQGYSGFSHTGGVATGNRKHNVGILFDEENVGLGAGDIIPEKTDLPYTTETGELLPPKIKPRSMNEIKYLQKLKKIGKKGLKSLPLIGGAISLGSALYSDKAGAEDEAIVDMIDPTGLLSPSSLGSGELSPEEMRKRKQYNDLIKKMKQDAINRK